MESQHASMLDLQRGLRWFRWRALVFFLVFGLGLAALEAGVALSERSNAPDSSLLTHIYYTMGLFVFGGLDLGTPSGGPAWARALLWFVYFAAPTVTTSAVVEGVLRAIQPRAWRRRRPHGHIVIGGCGRLAMLYLRRFHDAFGRRPILILDDRPDNPNAHAAAELYRAEVVTGDLGSQAVLDSLHFSRANSAAFLSGDDYANLDAASHVLKSAPRLAGRIVAHISDIRLLRIIEQDGALQGITMFNSYRAAARRLVKETLLPHFHRTDPPDTVVLAGFGRFGQTVLHELQCEALGLLEMVMIVDLEADMRSLVFAEQIGFEDAYEHRILEADIRNPLTWELVRENLGGALRHPVIVLGTGDDSINIRTALSLCRSDFHAKLVARCFHSSTFREQISRECEFTIVSTADLLLESLPPLSADGAGFSD